MLSQCLFFFKKKLIFLLFYIVLALSPKAFDSFHHNFPPPFSKKLSFYSASAAADR